MKPKQEKVNERKCEAANLQMAQTIASIHTTTSVSSSLQGDVQEEVQGEKWSDAGHHPPRNLPAANVLQPNRIYALLNISCLHLISINHSNLNLHLNPSAPINYSNFIV